MTKIKKIGKITIKGNEIFKKDKDNSNIFKYLKAKEFTNFLEYKDRIENTSQYEYIEDYSINNQEKMISYIKTLSLLHNKTSENHIINKAKIIDIKENIMSYTNYLEKEYNKYLEQIEILKYPSPSNTLFLENYSSIKRVLEYIRNELINWFNLINSKNKIRTCLIHNNVSIDHFIENKEKYIISWDKARIDTPIIDIINLYKQYWNEYEFNSLLEMYLEKCHLTEEELKLLMINIAIPPKLKINSNELINIKETYNLFKYIEKTEELIRPYYSIKNKEK